MAYLPLSIRLHDGLQDTCGWESSAVSGASHVVQMIEDAYLAAETFGDSFLLLDRYFLSVPALQRLQELTGKGTARMEIVTKAKRNCTAFEKPFTRKTGRERPSKKRQSHSSERTVSFHKNISYVLYATLYSNSCNIFFQ